MKKAILLFIALISWMTGSAQYKMDTILYAGDSKIFTDIVFLGDGFKEDEMQTFIDFVKKQTSSFFGKMPWEQYRNRFNVFCIETPSNESGAGMTPDAPIDNFFGVCFGTSGVDRMPWPTKFGVVYDVLTTTKPDYDIVPIVVNSYKYGGGGGVPFICYSMEENSIETLRHEFGHAFAGLADEYWYKGKESANMTQIIDPVKWQSWMGTDEVGTYRYSEKPEEEGYTWYRPHQDCLMRYLNREYCPVCREALIEKIHVTSKDIISFTPENEQALMFDGQKATFKLNLLKPDPNTLRTNWLLDGTNAGHNVEEITLNSSQLQEGTHNLTVMVEDTTLLVHTENHTALHGHSVTWEIVSDGSTAISSAAQSEDFTIGPLPFSSHISFSSTKPIQGPVRMELLDLSGRTLVSVHESSGASVLTLNTSHIPSGIYILRIYKGNLLFYSNKVTNQKL